MQRLLTILGPLPFMALAILAAGCSLGVAIFVFQLLSAIALVPHAKDDRRAQYRGRRNLRSPACHHCAVECLADSVLRAHWTMDVLAGLFAGLTVGLIVL